MSDLVRFSVSLESDLLEEFERYSQEHGAATRSEAIRLLIRRALTEDAWAKDTRDAVATLTLVYDHHRAGLLDQLTEVQHGRTEMVVSTMHVHLNHTHCLEVIILRGQASDLRDVASRVRGIKGVRCGELVMAHAPEAGDAAAGGHHHHH